MEGSFQIIPLGGLGEFGMNSMAVRDTQTDDIIVIAGKGHEDYQDIQGKKHPFDDRKVARQLLFHTKTARAQEREEREAEREAMRGGFGPPPDRRF